MSLFDTVSLGAVYIMRRERSREEIARDIGSIAQTGLSSITVWPTVSWWDKPERPGPSFDTTRFIFDECEKHGIKVIAELIGQNPGHEMVPDYRMKKEYFIDLTAGRMSYWQGHRNWSNPVNYNHPEVKKIIAETMTACAEALKDHPAFAAWDVFNETNFTSYDPITLEIYRGWLKEKYGGIEALNEAWERTFRDFPDIIFTSVTEGYYGWGSLVPIRDEDEFRCWNLASLVAEWTSTLHAADPDHPVIVDNGLSTDVWHYRGRGTDDWKIARAADISGVTYYPFSNFDLLGRESTPIIRHEDLYIAGAVLTGVRSAAIGDTFLVSELQTHHQSLLKAGTGIGPAEVELITWQAIAHGVRSVTYWKWRPFIRGRQTSSRGLTAYDGTPTERSHAAARVASTLKKHPDTLGSLKPPKPRAALLLDSAGPVYTEGLPGRHEYYISHEILGFQRLLAAEGIETAYLHAQFLEGVDFSEFPLIILPAQVVVEEDVAEKLRDYVAGGGTVVASSRLAVMNQQNYLYTTIPGAGLSEVFGVKETNVAPAGEVIALAELGELPGGGPFLQALEVSSEAEIIDRFGDVSSATGAKVSVNGMPAIVRNKFGEGTAWYFAFDLGYNTHHILDEGQLEKTIALFEKLLPVECFDPIRILERGAPGEVHCLPCAQGEVLIALNHVKTPQTIRVLLGESLKKRKITALDAGNDAKVSVAGKGKEVDFNLPPLGIGIAHVEKA